MSWLEMVGDVNAAAGKIGSNVIMSFQSRRAGWMRPQTAGRCA